MQLRHLPAFWALRDEHVFLDWMPILKTHRTHFQVRLCLLGQFRRDDRDAAGMNLRGRLHSGCGQIPGYQYQDENVCIFHVLRRIIHFLPVRASAFT